ncbi:MAG: hypothetical protein M3044_03680 [Thermoproteota archaeon]|nr:hypothetical protein [Thermoproteota archaeon]
MLSANLVLITIYKRPVHIGLRNWVKFVSHTTEPATRAQHVCGHSSETDPEPSSKMIQGEKDIRGTTPEVEEEKLEKEK